MTRAHTPVQLLQPVLLCGGDAGGRRVILRDTAAASGGRRRRRRRLQRRVDEMARLVSDLLRQRHEPVVHRHRKLERVHVRVDDRRRLDVSVRGIRSVVLLIRVLWQCA
jgi:hypothetical protein